MRPNGWFHTMTHIVSFVVIKNSYCAKVKCCYIALTPKLSHIMLLSLYVMSADIGEHCYWQQWADPSWLSNFSVFPFFPDFPSSQIWHHCSLENPTFKLNGTHHKSLCLSADGSTALLIIYDTQYKYNGASFQGKKKLALQIFLERFNAFNTLCRPRGFANLRMCFRDQPWI